MGDCGLEAITAAIVLSDCNGLKCLLGLSTTPNALCGQQQLVRAVNVLRMILILIDDRRVARRLDASPPLESAQAHGWLTALDLRALCCWIQIDLEAAAKRWIGGRR